MDWENKIKEHFESEAGDFDDIILKLIPYYPRMLEALTSSLPFEAHREIEVLDLGCGTGNVSKSLLAHFPKAKLTLVDMAQNMLDLAKGKLGTTAISECIATDFSELHFEKSFDAVLSSLALHHLDTDQFKKEFYARIFRALKPGGVFVNADVILGSNKHLQNMYIQKWIKFMSKSCTSKEIHEKWLEKYKAEDRPARLAAQLKWLEDIGFKAVDVVWKYYNFAVYCGFKTV